ncbi:PAS domain-containing sensor histidine kinase [Inediibacterium massiliense]|uniref:sensor histidine kinase n=1 Tax=Inediibacterium massiliense TaxID=1658111 RepID=UPI0006B4C144|nr:PAS domain-containing sensor histidine kinase [Inediibacterium massiliense]
MKSFFSIENRKKLNANRYFQYVVFLTIFSEIFLYCAHHSNICMYILGYILKIISFYYLYKVFLKKDFQKYDTKMNDYFIQETQPYKTEEERLLFKKKQSEKIRMRLEKNLQICKKFIEILPLPIVIRDQDKIVYINDETKNLLKLKSKEDAIGKSLLDFLQDDCKDMVKERLILESQQKIGLPLEEQLVCTDGSIVDVEVCVTSIDIDDQEYFMGILRDITHLKKFKKIEKELAEKDEYDRIRSEFFANISHELRTPVNVIYSALQLEEMYFAQQDYESIRKYNKMVKQNCMRLLRIINNLIDMTKINAGYFEPILKGVNIVEVVENIVLSIVDFIKSRDMNIIFDTQLEEDYVNCDINLIERIILNILSNSIKYGKVKGSIEVNIYDEEDRVCISIKDDGIGIPKDQQERIFERFIRIDQSLTRNCEGSGIGLSLVKSLVELQNGTVTLMSDENMGTEIIIKFPRIQMEEDIFNMDSESKEMDQIIKKVELEFSDIYEA